MTSIERVSRFLKRQCIDRIPVHEHFWNDTIAEYTAQGHLKEGESYSDHFNQDIGSCWGLNLVADLDFEPETIDETDETITIKDGNGAILRRHKLHDATPEHVDFTVKSSAEWEEYKPFLTKIDERRINFESYRKAKEESSAANRFFVMSGVNVFEAIHPLTGHENMLIGMALEPDWILDMCKTYSDLILSLHEILFEKEGKPDGIWYYEDMGFKQRPFMSPAMYQELIMPSHKRTIDYAHSNEMPVIMHSCGFVEPLLPHMIEAGIDCYQTIEIKAGMDVLKLHKEYGDVLSLMGGIDVRTLYTNDRKAIDEELESKIPILKQGFGYCLHSDHSIPKTVEYDTLKYYFERGLELGQY